MLAAAVAPVHAQALALALAPALVDAPELARPGPHAVGLRRLAIDVGPVPMVEGGAGGTEKRRLEALLWYPAVQGTGVAEGTLRRPLLPHPWRPWLSSTQSVAVPSSARREAIPAPAAGALPVVIAAHGLLRFGEMHGDLGEHLASRGYAVLALSHEDERHADPLRSALVMRPRDIAAAVRTLDGIHRAPSEPLQGRLSLEKVGLAGYSMGGYGALIAAGARVPSDGAAYAYGTPAGMQAHAGTPDAAGVALASRVGAVLALAPWGAQPAYRALDAGGLSTLRAPMLLVVGEQDDISGYADGVRRIFDGATAAPRWLLSLEAARHNIAGHGLPGNLPGGFEVWESFEEPVWRRSRLQQVVQHLAVAFFDTQLRQDVRHAAVLAPAVERAADGQWPQPPGTRASEAVAGAAVQQHTHWAGFQRRWAVGMRLERREPRP
jgi:predicted dienelactone hydrolase